MAQENPYEYGPSLIKAAQDLSNALKLLNSALTVYAMELREVAETEQQDPALLDLAKSAVEKAARKH